jgi:hypothetical protein
MGTRADADGRMDRHVSDAPNASGSWRSGYGASWENVQQILGHWLDVQHLIDDWKALQSIAMEESP